MLSWIYSPRQNRSIVERLREAVVKVIEEDRNSARSDLCYVARTVIERDGKIIDGVNGDQDVLCFAGDTNTPK